MRVGAIGEAAEIDKRPHLAEVTGNLLGNHVPQLERANAGRIDQVPRTKPVGPVTGQRNQPSRRGCVAAFLIFLRHLADLQR